MFASAACQSARHQCARSALTILLYGCCFTAVEQACGEHEHVAAPLRTGGMGDGAP